MNEVYLNFPIPTENLNFGPLHVTEAALNLGFGETGAFVQGYADVAIDQIGRGRVEGRIERGGPVITGTFGFDMDFLNPASMRSRSCTIAPSSPRDLTEASRF